jgi:uncharacterized protein HemY
LGDSLRMQDRYTEASEKLQCAMDQFTAIGHKLGVAQCLQSLGDILRMQDRYTEASEKLQCAMDQFTAIGDKLGIANCLQILENMK